MGPLPYETLQEWKQQVNSLHDPFIAGIPKIELHVHIEGTLTPELRFKLGQQNNIALQSKRLDRTFATLDQLREMYNLLQPRSVKGANQVSAFFDAYYGGMEVLRTQEDFYELAMDYFKKAAKMKVKSQWIMCMLRDVPLDSAMEHYEAALPYRDIIVGIGLDSNEYDRSPSLFEPLYLRARADGFKLTCHCDVTQKDTHEHIRQVAESVGNTGADRLDHRLDAAQRPELIALLKEKGVGVTLWPWAYVRHHKEEDLFAYVRALFDAGIKVNYSSSVAAAMESNRISGGSLDAEAIYQRVRGMLSIPEKVRQEFFIHLCLNAALSWGLGKTESLDWELLTLGPKGGVPPPEPLLWTFGYNRVLVFGVLALICITPRLYMGPKAIMAHGGDNLYPPGWPYGLIWALIHHYPKMLFPLWGQWICFLYSYLNMTPVPTSIAGIEGLLMSILGCLLALPPALVFATYRFCDVVIHPLRRNWAGDRSDSGVLSSQQSSVFWFLRIYVMLLVPERHFSSFSTGFAFWSFWACVAGGPVVYMALALLWNMSYGPESYNSQPWEEKPFHYAPLADKGHIRLLKVLPMRRRGAPVVCNLIQVELDGRRPSYDAISYRWHTESRDSTKPNTITINGFKFAVYPNVLAILKDVRSVFLPQYIWIDSICINQDDLREKESQVALMRQIYESSLHVVIHLPESGRTQSDLQDIARTIFKVRDTRVLHEFSRQDGPGELITLGSNHDWDLLQDLLDDSWFVRVWIVQEVTVARQVRLRLGGQAIPWGDFVRACAAISRSGVRGYIHHRYLIENLPPPEMAKKTKMVGVEHTLILDNLRQWYASGQRLPLLDTMILCLRFKSTWEVDKLYGLLGIIDAQDRRQLKPDYTRDKTTVFRDLACQILETVGSEEQFRLIRFAGIGQLRNMPDLPSWVPDWTAGLSACPLESRDEATAYKASTKCAKKMHLSPSENENDPDFLVINGIAIDRVVLLCDVSQIPPPEDVTHFPIRDALAAVKAHGPDRDTYRSTRQTIDEAFWRTLIADRDTLYRPAADDILNIWEVYFRVYDAVRSGLGKAELMARLLQGGPQDDDTWELRRLFAAIWFWQADDEDLWFSHMLAADLSKRWPDHQHAIGAARILNRPFDVTQATEPRMSAGRQFCITAKGYFGLVPKLTTLDDAVVLFDGAKTPHIVRPSRNWDLTNTADNKLPCRLVGECFIHEGMDGQLEKDPGFEAQEKSFVLE
ncbi:adenosine deaminase [Seiridium cupressi]